MAEKGVHKRRHGRRAAPIRAYRAKSSRPSEQFGRAIGVTRISPDSGAGHGQGGDVSQGIQVGGAAGVANPKALLAGSLKAKIVAFTFGTQGICPLKLRTFPVNGKTVVRGNGFVFGAASVFLAIVPVFVVTGAVLPPLYLSALRGTVQDTENRIWRLLFKLAVEQDMVMNVLAAGMEISEEQLRDLRGWCVQNVKKTNGSVTLEGAVRYQKGID